MQEFVVSHQNPRREQCKGLLRKVAVGLLALITQSAVLAQSGGQLPLLVGTGGSGVSFSVPVQTLLFFTALSFLPAVLLMMTGFTRIVICLLYTSPSPRDGLLSRMP